MWYRFDVRLDGADGSVRTATAITTATVRGVARAWQIAVGRVAHGVAGYKEWRCCELGAHGRAGTLCMRPLPDVQRPYFHTMAEVSLGCECYCCDIALKQLLGEVSISDDAGRGAEAIQVWF